MPCGSGNFDLYAGDQATSSEKMLVHCVAAEAAAEAEQVEEEKEEILEETESQPEKEEEEHG